MNPYIEAWQYLECLRNGSTKQVVGFIYTRPDLILDVKRLKPSTLPGFEDTGGSLRIPRVWDCRISSTPCREQQFRVILVFTPPALFFFSKIYAQASSIIKSIRDREIESQLQDPQNAGIIPASASFTFHRAPTSKHLIKHSLQLLH
jgi:hypothetical protein